MIQLPEDRRPPMTPQLALRVTIVGSCALAMFAIIFFRLWFLQVLSGDQYLNAATVNRVRDVAIAAPRGEVLSSTGSVLVGSTKALEAQISAPDLPHSAGGQAVVFRRLARVLGISTRKIKCKVAGPPPTGGTFRVAQIPCDVKQQLALLPYADVDIKQVSKYVQYYLAEREQQFRGVQVAQVYIPSYPQGDLAAQLLGTVGRITAQECWGTNSPKSTATLCTTKAYRGVDPNAVIGQAGLEGEYDRYLRGIDGSEQVQIDAFGQPTRDLKTTPPVPGHNLALSLDANLQRVGQQALATSIASNPGADAGSFVAMNPQNGQIYAMGSYPTFNPSIFTKPVSYAEYKALTNPNGGDPLLNRAIQSAGPTGSTFKPITATAALESGAWTTSDIYDDTGTYTNGPGDVRHNAGNAVDGTLDLVNAIRVSSDDFFYNLGRLTNADPATHPQRRPARPVGAAVRDRPEDRRRPPRRGVRDAADAALAREPQQARSRVRQRDRAVPLHQRDAHELAHAPRLAPQPEACAGRLRDRRRDQPAVVGRRQREPRRRPGRRPGDAAAARRRVLGARQRRLDRHPAPRAQRPEHRRHRAAADRPGARAAHHDRPVLSPDDPRWPAGGSLAAGRNLS